MFMWFIITQVLVFVKSLQIFSKITSQKTKVIFYFLGISKIHLNKQNSPDTIIFQDFMDSFGLVNHINQSTHTSNHILDLVISQPEFSPIVRTAELSHFLSGHCFMHVLLLVDRPIPSRKHIKYWKMKSIDQNKFSHDLYESFNTEAESQLDRMLQHNTELGKVLEKHAPEKSKYIRNTHQQPWFNNNIKSEIVLRRKKERISKRDQTQQAWNDFYIQCQNVANIIKEAQTKPLQTDY